MGIKVIHFVILLTKIRFYEGGHDFKNFTIKVNQKIKEGFSFRRLVKSIELKATEEDL